MPAHLRHLVLRQFAVPVKHERLLPASTVKEGQYPFHGKISEYVKNKTQSIGQNYLRQNH
jgi:hypothetical protein